MDLVKVAIADDHKIFRKGVILSLRQYTNIKFVLEADNGQELINNLEETNQRKRSAYLVCMEYAAQEIAQKMDISARTVEAIKDRLMERFGVKNSVGLVFYSMKNSLIY